MVITEDSSMKAVTAATYATAVDHFDDPALSFWDRFGRRTLDRVSLRPGERVLDACCGTGASALPAAHRVRPGGTVVAVDLSEQSLAKGRAKAEAQGLDNVEFRIADIEASGLPPASFDAVVCVFGIFFLPAMEAGLAELWRLVRPGGRLAITVWGPRIFEPATQAFWDAVAGERPDLVGGYHPWTRVTRADQLADLLRRARIQPAVAAGVGDALPEAEAGTHPLANVDDWWTIVLGTGYRATVEQLGPEAAERVRHATLSRLRAQRVRHIETNVVYSVTTKSR